MSEAERFDMMLPLLQDIQRRLGNIERNQEEATQRLGRVERLTADLHGDFAGLSVRVDSVGSRLDRIERVLTHVAP